MSACINYSNGPVTLNIKDNVRTDRPYVISAEMMTLKKIIACHLCHELPLIETALTACRECKMHICKNCFSSINEAEKSLTPTKVRCPFCRGACCIKLDLTSDIVRDLFSEAPVNCKYEKCKVSTKMKYAYKHNAVCMERFMACFDGDPWYQLNNSCGTICYGINKYFEHVVRTQCSGVVFSDHLRAAGESRVDMEPCYFHIRINDSPAMSIIGAEHDCLLRPLILMDSITIAGGFVKIYIKREVDGKWLIYGRVHAPEFIAKLWLVQVSVYCSEENKINYSHYSAPAHIYMTEEDVVEKKQGLVLTDADLISIRKHFQDSTPLFDLQVKVTLDQDFLKMINELGTMTVNLIDPSTRLYVTELGGRNIQSWVADHNQHENNNYDNAAMEENPN